MSVLTAGANCALQHRLSPVLRYAALTDENMPAESTAEAFDMLEAWTGVTPTLPEAEPAHAAKSGKQHWQSHALQRTPL